MKWQFFIFMVLLGFVGCAKPDPVQAAFQKCTKSITENIKSLENQPKAIRDIANGVASMGLKACEIIKTACEDRKNPSCQLILEQYK